MKEYQVLIIQNYQSYLKLSSQFPSCCGVKKEEKVIRLGNLFPGFPFEGYDFLAFFFRLFSSTTCRPTSTLPFCSS